MEVNNLKEQVEHEHQVNSILHVLVVFIQGVTCLLYVFINCSMRTSFVVMVALIGEFCNVTMCNAVIGG